ncbi:MAG TPA: S16 family serine protease [Candidatus Methanoperedens sp.]
MVEKLPEKDRPLKLIIAVLLILLLGSSLVIYGYSDKIKLLDKNINNLSADLENKKKDISQLEISIIGLEKNLSLKEEQLKNETLARQELEKEIINLTTVAKNQYYVIAVDENDRGHLIPLEVLIKSGKGNLFLNVANVLVDETLQSSAQTAIMVSRDVTHMSLSDKDVLINVEAPVEKGGLTISGGSAGAAITLTAIATIQSRTIRNDVLITGTIREDHTIGKIGAVQAKALAAKEAGAVLFLVPVGQKSEITDVGIEVKEVASIEDAMNYAIS